MVLLNSQKNDLFLTIERSGTFTPNQFTFEDYQDTAKVQFKSTQYFYSIRKTPNKEFYYKMSPSSDDVEIDLIVEVWGQVIGSFSRWLQYLSKEIFAPNLWERLSENIQIANVTHNQSHAEFTAREYEDLKQRITALSSQMRTLPFLEGRFEEIDNKLAHLVTLGEKLSKFDWANLFLGTMMGILTNIGTSPENTKIVFDLIKQIFMGYFLN